MNRNQFKELFDTYYESIRSFIYYRIGDIDMADDIAQSVFMKFWERRNSIKLETAKSYLYKMASNAIVDLAKERKSKITFEVEERDLVGGENPLNIMEGDEFMDALQKAISDLSEAQREVFLMNRIEKLTYKEIAERLEISDKAVEKRMKGAIENLKEKLGRKL